ncbi:MAG TPA: winged helix-turn-helix domain-containing protein [Candidatus Elarobacter sp.]|jgi:DNA-binding winged helix-turn-helix (wHTH) protein/tetratricopeptide (TPR) repeat protein
MTSGIFRFGPFELDSRTRLLVRDGTPVALGPTVISTLAVLVANAGELVTKDELMERVWPDRCVDESNLSQNVYRLRRALSAAGLNGAIETMACRGYRFVAPVEHVRVPEPVSVNVPAAKTMARSQRWALAALAGACSVVLVASAVSSPRPAFARLSPESQRLYKLGRYHWNLRMDLAHVYDSARYFRGVVKRDPANPLGYAGLADAYLSEFDVRCDSNVTGCRRIAALATGFARKALAADPQSAEAHTSLAMALYVFEHRDAESDAEFGRAIRLDPQYALAHHWYGNSLLVRGLLAQATAQHEAALALEPASPATYAWLAEDAYFGKRYRDAIAYARESLAIYPERHGTRVVLGLSYERVGDDGAALATFARLSRVERTALVAALQARKGRRAAAIGTLGALRRDDVLASGSTLSMALAWLAVGDRSRAYAYMKATPFANRIEHSFVALDPRLDALRSDARFKQWTTPD